jgi:hypothetical protein
MGLSGKMTAAEQAKLFGDAWEELPEPRPQLSLQIYNQPAGETLYFNLGPHPPRLWPEDLALLHRLWLELSERGGWTKLHHRDVIRVALRRLDSELHSAQAGEILETLRKEVAQEAEEPAGKNEN